MNVARIPVTLLTGFLGAGKTTLLNAVLADASSGRIAVIVNEFGEAGLDHDLIEESSEEIVLMRSGCLCCTVRGDLSKTFAKLIKRRNAGELHFDRVVIETTGMADPGPILQTLTVDPFLVRSARMDGVVTVVDAVNGPGTLDAQFEAVSQVALADLIVLSKTDLVTPTEADAVLTRLRSHNPTADIIRPQDKEFGPKRLWGLSGMRDDATPKDVLAWTMPKAADDPFGNLSGMVARPVSVLETRAHDSDITSISIILNEAIEDDVFDRWFDMLISFKGRDILRAKGILFLKDIEKPFAFHGVQHIFEPPVPLENWTGDDRRTRIVLIGRNLNSPEIQKSLELLQGYRPRHAVLDTQNEVSTS